MDDSTMIDRLRSELRSSSDDAIGGDRFAANTEKQGRGRPRSGMGWDGLTGDELVWSVSVLAGAEGGLERRGMQRICHVLQKYIVLERKVAFKCQADGVETYLGLRMLNGIIELP